MNEPLVTPAAAFDCVAGFVRQCETLLEVADARVLAKLEGMAEETAELKAILGAPVPDADKLWELDAFFGRRYPESALQADRSQPGLGQVAVAWQPVRAAVRRPA